jgi:hypothetical protein
MKRFLVHKKNGITLVEIMMVVAVMGVLFLGLFSLINKVTKGTWQIGGTLGMNSAASEAMYWIGNDFRNAKASTMGGQLVNNSLGDEAMNPGFELPLNLISDTPANWASLSAYGVSRVSGPTVIRSGFLALGLPPGTSYYSLISTTTYTARDYVVSGWTYPAGKSELRLLQGIPADTDFAIPCFSSSPASTNWVHLTKTINLATNTPFKFRMVFPTGTIVWFKKMSQAVDTAGRDYGFYYSRGLGTYKNYLYMADKRDAVSSIGPVKWYGVDKDIWDNVSQAGLPLGNEQNYYYNLVPSLTSEYNGVVYAFRSRTLPYPNNEQANMYTFNGTNWNLLVAAPTFYQGSLSEGRSDVNCYAVFQDRLYVGGIWRYRLVGLAMYPEPTVWRYDYIGPSWTRPYQDAAAQDAVIDLCVHNNRLYALCVWLTSTRLVFSDDGITWFTDAAFTAKLNTDFGAGGYFGQKMVSYNGNLYVGIYPLAGNTRLYYWNGAAWQTNNPNLFLNEPCNIYAMSVHNNILYIGTGASGVGNPGGKIYSLNTAPPLVQEYVLPGVNSTKGIKSFALFNGILYANYEAVSMGPPNIGESGILQLGGVNYFDDVCMSPRQVVLSTSTTDANYEYYTSKGAGANEGNRFRRYRLNYTAIASKQDPAYPGIVRRQRYAGGSWINDGQENFCNNVKQLIIINNNQESFDVELVLEKIIDVNKTKEYRVKSRFTPSVP